MPVIFLNQNEQALMPIPDFQTTMLLLLRFCGDEKEHSLREAIEFLGIQFGLSNQERKQMLPSGLQNDLEGNLKCG